MKLVKKWLLPVLICLAVAEAAVLPPHLSLIRDHQQFRQVHIEELAADSLPIRETPTLPERLALYVSWMDDEKVVPSFQSPGEEGQAQAKELIRAALERLAQAGVIPEKLLVDKAADPEIAFWTYFLLWNPESSIAGQAPVGFWRVTADLGDCPVQLDIDQESGLPVRLSLYDLELAQWLAWKDTAAQAAVGRGFLSLLGLEVEEARPDAVDPGSVVLSVADAEFYCSVMVSKATLIVELRPGWEMTDGANGVDR